VLRGGVSNEPGGTRVFDPVKQALEFDKDGKCITAYVPELRSRKLHTENKPGIINQKKPTCLFQPWRLSEADKEMLSLKAWNF
jgi:deoxyribodipyrimidine photo-lyase